MEKISRILLKFSRLKILTAVLLIIFSAFIYIFGTSADRVSSGLTERDISILEADNKIIRDTSQYAGIEKEYSFSIPEIEEPGENIFIYLIHQFSEIYVDGIKVDECMEPEGFHVGNTPGCYWIRIPYDDYYTGKELRIITRPAYNNVVNRDPYVFAASSISMISYLLYLSLNEIIVSIMCLISGFIFMIGMLFLKIDKRSRAQIFYLGGFTFCVGIWRFTELRISSLLFPYMAKTFYFISVFAVLYGALTFTCFIGLAQESHRTFYLHLRTTITAEILILTVLQAFNIVQLRAYITFILLTLLASVMPVFIFSIINLKKAKDMELLDLLQNIIYIAFVLAAVYDIFRYYRTGGTRYRMMLLAITFIHLILMAVVIVRNTMIKTNKIHEMESKLQREQSMLMLSQIQPHFVFNSLGVIRELCYSDPEAAENAVVKFSNYLRRNMDSLSCDSLISFREELNHVKNYIDLEQLRFGDKLDVEYDIEDNAFMLPVLSLQPIVENAVRHGLRKKSGKGRIKISSIKRESWHEIIIEDNGIGFDVETDGLNKKDDKYHIGLSNVKTRIETMCSGRLMIASKPGAGTCITISIPDSQEGNN